MLISSALDQMELEAELEKSTRQQYRRSVDRFSEYLTRPSRCEDLSIENANAWLAWIPSRFSIGPTSVRNHRSGLIRVWNYCSDVLEIVPCCQTRRIRRPKIPPKIVRAWTLDNLDILIECAAGIAGKLHCGIPACDFLLGWLWVGYETAFRPGDLRKLRWENIDFNTNTITIVQHKTQTIHSAIIGIESRDVLQRLQKHRQDRVFPLEKFGVIRWEKILYRIAEKHGFHREKRQGFGTLRKTHATEIYRQYGLEAAAMSLGHRSGTATVKNHYVDSAQLSQGRRPPSPRGRTG